MAAPSPLLPGERPAPSTAAINGHPLHPMVVPFPIAFLVAAAVADLVFWGTADPFWARAAAWLLGAGLVMGAIAAILGAIDFFTIPQARSARVGWPHLIGNAVALLIALWNTLHRLDDPPASVLPGGLIASLVTAAILFVTGWLGGELAYRHRIGVVEEEERREAAPAGFAYAGTKPGDRPEERPDLKP